MQVLPVLRRVAAKGIVEILAFRQVSLHLHVLGLNDVAVLLIREEETAAIVIEVIVEERVQSVHVASRTWGRAWLLSFLA